jgi:hypothetical protein
MTSHIWVMMPRESRHKFSVSLYLMLWGRVLHTRSISTNVQYVTLTFIGSLGWGAAIKWSEIHWAYSSAIGKMRRFQSPGGPWNSVMSIVQLYNRIYWFLPVFHWVDSLIGPGGLLSVVSHTWFFCNKFYETWPLTHGFCAINFTKHGVAYWAPVEMLLHFYVRELERIFSVFIGQITFST